jgi:hypothetical protein
LQVGGSGLAKVDQNIKAAMEPVRLATANDQKTTHPTRILLRNIETPGHWDPM